MTVFTKNTPGAPTGGIYAIGDVITDSVNNQWTCVRGGPISTDPMNPTFIGTAAPEQFGSKEDTLTATPSGNQSTALALSAVVTVHNVTVVGSAADSVKLPLAVGSGVAHWVKNSAAANSLQLFGSGTDTIDGVATGTGVAIAAGKSRLCYDLAAGKWVSLLGA